MSKLDRRFWATQGFTHIIATPEVAKHRVFDWLRTAVSLTQLQVIARDDDIDLRYSPFSLSPSVVAAARHLARRWQRSPLHPDHHLRNLSLPRRPHSQIPAADYADDPARPRIAAAAKDSTICAALGSNPPDLVDIVPEITPTAAPGEAPRRYPDRILPKNAEAAVKLKQRTLTNLYNQRPRWLADAHDELDRAVAAAYGWPEDIATEEALARLLALNLERAAAQAAREG